MIRSLFFVGLVSVVQGVAEVELLAVAGVERGTVHAFIHHVEVAHLHLEDPAMGRNNQDEYDDPWTLCERCGNEMNMCLNEANLTCAKCGHQCGELTLTVTVPGRSDL